MPGPEALLPPPESVVEAVLVIVVVGFVDVRRVVETLLAAPGRH